MNNIYLLVAPSGAGKTAIQTFLNKKRNLIPVISYTTRPQRSDSEEGHIFVTEKEFNALVDRVAYTEYNGYRYCCTKQQIEESDLYIIDPDGVEFFKKVYKGNKDYKVIYINSPLHTRMERMESRGDSFNMALERVVNDAISFRGFEEKADFIVENGDNNKLADIAQIIWEFIYKTEASYEHKD